MTPERLAEIKARAEAASAGPWYTFPEPIGDHYYVGSESGDDVADCLANNDLARQNATFIAHAPTDVPALVAEVERLRGTLQAIGDLADASVDAVVVVGILRRTAEYGLRASHQEYPPASTTPGLSG